MSRILIDISALWQHLESTPHDVWDAQRKTAIGVLRTDTSTGLPVVFDGEALYAVDPDLALQWLLSPMTSMPPSLVEHAQVSDGPNQRSGGLFVGTRQLARRSRSVVGRRLVRLAPERAQAELREALRHVERALRLWLRPPSPPEAPAYNTSQNRPPLASRVYPGPDDVLWTCGPIRESAALRWVAEVKRVCGFRVGSLCLAVDGVATIDQLDAADVIVCQSSELRDQLTEFAVANGRSTSNAHVLSVETDLATASWVDELIDGVRKESAALHPVTV
jgi:hypothetical protein